MKNSAYNSTSLDELYGPVKSGPLPVRATNWTQIAIYSGIAISVTIIYLYGVHCINEHNTKLWTAQFKLVHDGHENLRDKVDKISLDVEGLKLKHAPEALRNQDGPKEI